MTIPAAAGQARGQIKGRGEVEMELAVAGEDGSLAAGRSSESWGQSDQDLDQSFDGHRSLKR